MALVRILLGVTEEFEGPRCHLVGRETDDWDLISQYDPCQWRWSFCQSRLPSLPSS